MQIIPKKHEIFHSQLGTENTTPNGGYSLLTTGDVEKTIQTENLSVFDGYSLQTIGDKIMKS